MNSSDSPIIVDFDSALIHPDFRAASFVAHFKARPWNALVSHDAGAVDILDSVALPYRLELCQFLHAQRARGRRVYLATSADANTARAIASHCGLFDGVITDGRSNRCEQSKLAAIQSLVGADFSYVGSRTAEMSIWNASSSAILVNAPRSLEAQLSKAGKIERVFPRERVRLSTLISAVRPYQWLKNLLVFVPLLTSFQFSNLSSALACLMTFVALSLCASATYIINDLFDLESDRLHPRKKMRPFASGSLRISHGLLAGLAMLIGGLTLGVLVEPLLLWVLGAYVATTLAYTLHIKGFVLLDVIVLAALYAIRLIAGAVAISVEISVWLFAFAFFMFVSLALIKRCAELVMFEEQGVESKRGRDYRVSDLRVLWPLGIAMGVASILVFALYLNSPEVLGRYRHPELLWVIPIALVYWLGRLWIKPVVAK